MNPDHFRPDQALSPTRSLPIVLRCPDRLANKVRYTFDTLFQAAGVLVTYVAQAPSSGPWLLYARTKESEASLVSCMSIAHCPGEWDLFDGHSDVEASTDVDNLPAVLPQTSHGFEDASDIRFDIIANAFYFLSSWSERAGQEGKVTRQLHATSVFARLGLPQDIVDLYLAALTDRLRSLYTRSRVEPWPQVEWPGGSSYAVVLSHDVDFLPSGLGDNAVQGAKTVLRHLVRQRDPADALKAIAGLARALTTGRDPYGCVPEIIARQKELGVRSSFQVAVGHRHRNDVNYRIEDDRVRDYLRAIPNAGFDLCLHGSYRSTEDPRWYVEEAALLGERLGQPLGSRQHFLSFDYDALFMAQEQAGIQYDMSMGFPDRPGPRAGFSYPYFPYDLRRDRPYRTLQISLFLMDVTLRGYKNLKGGKAWNVIEKALAELKRKGACVSAVWHPIVFGGARDPGYDELFWNLVAHVGTTGGVATDGRTINSFWRARATRYLSFGFNAAELAAPPRSAH